MSDNKHSVESRSDPYPGRFSVFVRFAGVPSSFRPALSHTRKNPRSTFEKCVGSPVWASLPGVSANAELVALADGKRGLVQTWSEASRGAFGDSGGLAVSRVFGVPRRRFADERERRNDLRVSEANTYL